MNLPDIPAVTAINGGIEPEFLSIADCFDRYRLKRGYINKLLAEGKVRSISLRERNRVRGRRLVVHDSLRNFILSHEVTPGDSEA